MYLQRQAYSERCQTSKMETYVKIVNGLKLLIVFAKKSILDVWQDSEYKPLYYKHRFNFFIKNRIFYKKKPDSETESD